MPIYEYRCNSCGAEKEHMQKMSDEPIVVCPACGSNDYIKLISAAGFQLKGSGWYVTDFKNNKKPESSQKTKPSTTIPPDTKTTSSAPKPSPSSATD